MAQTRFLLLCCVVCLAERAWAGAPLDRASRSGAKPVVRLAQSSPEQLPAPADLPADEVLAAERVPAQTAVATQDESWRYRYHLKRWWYYVKPGHWLFWDGRCWQDAQPTLPKQLPDGSVQRVGVARRALAAWPQVPSYREHHGWVGGFYSSGGGYGSSDFGYGYGVPSYGPGSSR